MEIIFLISYITKRYNCCDIIIIISGYIPPSLNKNIKVMSWIPQNDLLAHKDIKAFVSHVGHNSLYESAYHGVPVVAVPLCTDQFPNARKAEHFGIATVLDHKIMNAKQLSEAIQHVIDEPRYIHIYIIYYIYFTFL